MLRSIFIPQELAIKLRDEIRVAIPTKFVYGNFGNIFLTTYGQSSDYYEENLIDLKTETKTRNLNNTQNGKWCNAYTYEQVFEWFRDKEIFGFIERSEERDFFISCYIGYSNEEELFNKYKDNEIAFSDYNEARVNLIKKMIEVYKEAKGMKFYDEALNEIIANKDWIYITKLQEEIDQYISENHKGGYWKGKTFSEKLGEITINGVYDISFAGQVLDNGKIESKVTNLEVRLERISSEKYILKKQEVMELFEVEFWDKVERIFNRELEY